MSLRYCIISCLYFYADAWCTILLTLCNTHPYAREAVLHKAKIEI